MLVIFWVISAVGLYRIYPYIPKISPWNDLVTIAAALLGFGAFLFIYLVYRIGLVVEEDDPSDDQADASDAAESG